MSVKKQSNYFTLVELLVVISIIGILTSMLIPSLNKAREAGKNAYCLNNLKQQGVATMVYTGENDDDLPASYNGDGTNPPYWWGSIGLYMDSEDNQKSAAFSCPTVNYSDETINPLQYGANTEIFKHHPTPATPHLNQGFRLKVGAVYRPSETYMIADLSIWNKEFGECYPFNRSPASWAYLSNVYTDPDQQMPPYIQYDYTYTDDSIRIRFRHLGEKNANLAFPDGHARGKTMGSFTAKNIYNIAD
ncbi:MAG: type II secretion system GspH family protein [Lentisphaerales bacterium]|nr:type II secretion system GspH family protein [Lentisphaerales bacterium]